jgi:hypothetical protein
MESRPESPGQPEEPLDEKVARGRSGATPFLALGGVAFTIWAVVAVVAGGVLLLWWLL